MSNMKSVSIACLTALLCASAACSQTSPPASSTNADSVAASASAPDDASGSADAPVVLDCAKVFAPSDVASIFTVPAKVSRDQVFRGSCRFDTTNSVDPYGGDINIRAGGGDNMDFTLPWREVTESSHRAEFTALPGVGDQAFWRTNNSGEFLSRKGNIYCIVVLHGLDQASVNHIAEQSPDQRAKSLGALCNKAFAAH